MVIVYALAISFIAGAIKERDSSIDMLIKIWHILVLPSLINERRFDFTALEFIPNRWVGGMRRTSGYSSVLYCPGHGLTPFGIIGICMKIFLQQIMASAAVSADPVQEEDWSGSLAPIEPIEHLACPVDEHVFYAQNPAERQAVQAQPAPAWTHHYQLGKVVFR